MNKAGLLYLVVGSVAAALMGFTGREIATAFRLAAGRPGTDDDRRKSAYFWEAVARNAWMLGALGSALNFTVALGAASSSIGEIADRMIQSLVVILYGLVLAVVCLIPAMKLADKSGGGGRPLRPTAAPREPPCPAGSSATPSSPRPSR